MRSSLLNGVAPMAVTLATGAVTMIMVGPMAWRERLATRSANKGKTRCGEPQPLYIITQTHQTATASAPAANKAAQ